jgi:hypothetical protein
VKAVHRRARSRGLRTTLASIAVGLIVGSTVAVAGLGDLSTQARAADDSAVTVAARDQDKAIDTAPLPDLEVTVSQTDDLIAQGIEISWTGGEQSAVPSSQTGGSDFLQIMQCWGTDADGGPDRTTCQYGGYKSPGSARDNFRGDGSVAAEDVQYTYEGTGAFDQTYTSIPFKSATGVTVRSVDENRQRVKGVDVNNNQFFTGLTTNEVSWGGSGANGDGSLRFETQTVTESPGLGCGAPITQNGTTVGQSCWLVVIPRGSNDVGRSGIVDSGLFWDSWKHRIAIPLDFKPAGLRCGIGAAERQLAGSELTAQAIASWQPELCNQEGGAVFSMITGSESDAALAANGTAPAPLALTSRPLGLPDVQDDLLYAPVALSGVSIAFGVDRRPDAVKDIPQEALDRANLPFDSLKLTPRLVAKLLTASYVDALPTYADKKHIGYISPSEPGKNADNITQDPDFLAINAEEWKYQAIYSPAIADVLVPQGRSDAAWALWQYVLSDDEAVRWLGGEPDPWGMIVNPWSSTDASANPNGAPLELPREDFPKPDPVERTDPNYGGPVNLVTWRPYTSDLTTSAYYVLRGDGQVLGGWDPNALPPKYAKAARALPGTQRVLGVTSAAAAARYQVINASLRNAAGEFVAPTDQSLLAAAAVMSADVQQPQVYHFDSRSEAAKGATSAYPLTMPVYAATNPESTDAQLRSDYASFIAYAIGKGQEPGTTASCPRASPRCRRGGVSRRRPRRRTSRPANARRRPPGKASAESGARAHRSPRPTPFRSAAALSAHPRCRAERRTPRPPVRQPVRSPARRPPTTRPWAPSQPRCRRLSAPDSRALSQFPS